MKLLTLILMWFMNITFSEKQLYIKEEMPVFNVKPLQTLVMVISAAFVCYSLCTALLVVDRWMKKSIKKTFGVKPNDLQTK